MFDLFKFSFDSLLKILQIIFPFIFIKKNFFFVFLQFFFSVNLIKKCSTKGLDFHHFQSKYLLLFHHSPFLLPHFNYFQLHHFLFQILHFLFLLFYLLLKRKKLQESEEDRLFLVMELKN